VSRLVIEAVSRTFPGVRGGPATRALEPTSLAVADNDFICVLGPSGCGKSTLLRIVAGLDTPSSGRVLLDGVPVTGPGAERGMVFQSYTLFPWLTVRENVEFGLKRRSVPAAERERIVNHYLNEVGLAAFHEAYPKQLSGGMMQRVAIARALANRPEIIVADEPTGALDTASTEQVFAILRDIADQGQTVVVVTHDPALAARADRRIHIVDGKVAEITGRSEGERVREMAN